MFFFFFKQKTAYEMRISDWSSDVCSSDLPAQTRSHQPGDGRLSGPGKPSDRHEARRYGDEQIIGERQIMQGLGREVQIRRRRSLCCQCMGPDGAAALVMTRASVAKKLDLPIVADRKSTRLNSSH